MLVDFLQTVYTVQWWRQIHGCGGYITIAT